MSFGAAMNATHLAKQAEERGDKEAAERYYRIAHEIDLEDARQAELRLYCSGSSK